MKQWQRLTRISVYTVHVFILVWIAFQEFASPDYHWHLKMGLDLIEKGLSPFVDHYSFTYEGQPIKFPPWLFQASVALFYKLFGDPLGIVFYKIVFWLLPLVFIAKLARQMAWGVFAEVLGVIFFSQIVIFHRELRPEITFYTYSLILFLLINSLRKLNGAMTKVAPIFVLLVLWVNTHISSAFGFFVVFCYLGADLLQLLISPQKLNQTLFKKYLAICLILFIAGFVNPEFSHPLIAALQSKMEKWGELIVEYAPKPLTELPLFSMVYFPFLLVSFVSLIIRCQVAGIFIVTILSYKTFYIWRLVYQLVMLTIPLVCVEINSIVNFWKNRAVKWSKVSKGLAVLIVVGLLSFSFYNTFGVRIVSFVSLAESNIYSEKVIQYIKSRGLKGRIFNEYAAGGFLIFHTYPDLRVVIDGRTNILYPFEFMKRYVEATYSPTKFLEMLKEYNFNYVLASNRAAAGNLLQVAVESGKFGIEYQDLNVTLLERGSKAFPYLNLAVASPSCLKPKDLPKIKLEALKANEFLSQDSPGRKIYELVLNHYFSNRREEIKYSLVEPAPAVIKIINQIALNRGHFDITFKLIAALNGRLSARDRLELASELCHKNKCQGAEQVIDFLLPKEDVGPAELVKLAQIVEAIQKGPGFKFIYQTRVNNLKQKVQPYLLNPKKIPAEIILNCQQLRTQLGAVL